MRRNKTGIPNIILLFILFLAGCSQSAEPAATAPKPTNTAMTITTEAPAVSLPDRANIVSVSASGEPGAYQFSVEISSPDEGCNQYADWWEVIDTEGNLIYRRILQHSHVNEQPFVRSGGPVAIEEDTIVWIRTHMNPEGYGGIVYKGSVQSGFQEGQPEPEFAAELERMPPLPDSCAF
jgi:hypothetical protein